MDPTAPERALDRELAALRRGLLEEVWDIVAGRKPMPEDVPSAAPYLVFDATLPPEATMPIKPTRDTTLANGSVLRRVRVWLDGYLDPGDTEKFLLLDGETFEVTVRRKGKVPPG